MELEETPPQADGVVKKQYISNVQKLWQINNLIKSRPLSMAIVSTKNQEERDRDETKNYSITSV